MNTRNLRGFETVPGNRSSAHKRHRTFLREWRLYRGLTLEQVGKRIEREHSTLTRMETGQSAYTQHTLEGLADVYQCSVTDLLSRNPGADAVADVARDPAVAADLALQAAQIAVRIASAPADVQRKALRVLAALLDTDLGT